MSGSAVIRRAPPRRMTAAPGDLVEVRRRYPCMSSIRTPSGSWRKTRSIPGLVRVSSRIVPPSDTRCAAGRVAVVDVERQVRQAQLAAAGGRPAVRRRRRVAQQLDGHATRADELRHDLHVALDLDREVEPDGLLAVELVALGGLEAQALAVEAERAVDVGDAEADVGRAVLGSGHLGAPGRRAVVTAASLGFAAMGVTVDGTVAPGFEAVRDAFVAIRAGRRHRRRGGRVPPRPYGVDLWGGEADSTAHRPWSDDTVVGIFSGTKGLTAIAAHLLVERGDPTSTHRWPITGRSSRRPARATSPCAGCSATGSACPTSRATSPSPKCWRGSRSCGPWPRRRRRGNPGPGTATTCARTAGWSAR